MIAQTPTPPYYAVIFTSLRTDVDAGYVETAQQMMILAQTQPGFLGVESARTDIGITVSYWDSLENIAAWKQVAEHANAQGRGRCEWYRHYAVRICKVERDYFGAEAAS